MALYSKVMLKELFIPSAITVRIRAVIRLFASRYQYQNISALSILNQGLLRQVPLNKVIVFDKYNLIRRSRLQDSYTGSYIGVLGKTLQYKRPRGYGEVNILLVIDIIRRYTYRPLNSNSSGLGLSARRYCYYTRY